MMSKCHMMLLTLHDGRTVKIYVYMRMLKKYM